MQQLVTIAAHDLLSSHPLNQSHGSRASLLFDSGKPYPIMDVLVTSRSDPMLPAPYIHHFLSLRIGRMIAMSPFRYISIGLSAQVHVPLKRWAS